MYKITVNGAPRNTAYVMYINDMGRVTAGNIFDDSYSFEVDDKYQGTGNISFTFRRKARTYQNVIYIENINAKGSDINIDLDYRAILDAHLNRPPKEKEKQKPQKKDGQEKKVLKNNLRDAILGEEDEKKGENKIRKAVQKNKQSKKNSFWDNLK